MEISKEPTGIEGFDQISAGGIPRNRTTLVLGSPGSGKTVFALQTLVNAARNGKPGIFVAFEERAAQVRENASVFDWGTESLTDDDLFYIDAHISPDVVSAGDFDLNALLAILDARAKKMNATTVIFDGLDILLTMLPDENAQRREIHRIRHWLGEKRLTGILTAKIARPATAENEIEFSFLQYASDCVVMLTNQLTERVSSRALRIIKYRGSKHSTNQFAVIISEAGLEVEGFTSEDMSHIPSNERISTGVGGLDEMMEGGYYRGSCVLISGVPGAFKTTIAAAAAYASCERGEPALFVSFEDAPETMVRNFKTVGMDFDRFIEKGLMTFHAVRSATFGTEQHVVNLKRLAEKHNAKMLVIDPVSALLRSSHGAEAESAAIRLIDYSRSKGITLFITSMPQYGFNGPESTPLEISTMSDAWLHIGFTTMDGGRRREFTILKARGTAHSNDVMEIEISEEHGIRLKHAPDLRPSGAGHDEPRSGR